MKTKSEVSAIVSSQDRQYKVRRMAFRLIMEFGSVSLARKIANDEPLKSSEVNEVFNVAKIHHPIPDSKAKIVYWALVNKMEFQSFNQFGQALK